MSIHGHFSAPSTAAGKPTCRGSCVCLINSGSVFALMCKGEGPSSGVSSHCCHCKKVCGETVISGTQVILGQTGRRQGSPASLALTQRDPETWWKVSSIHIPSLLSSQDTCYISAALSSQNAKPRSRCVKRSQTQ